MQSRKKWRLGGKEGLSVGGKGKVRDVRKCEVVFWKLKTIS